MKALDIRTKFLEFFRKNGHTIVPSSPLIPAEDPTLLFANAGMNQFKDVFLGQEKRRYTCAASIQKCVRAGGKHNDLDEVGFTDRHLTFFEMMGNFSFGDYFKKEAIQYAWDFLTKDMGIPAEKLYPTVFKTDDETFDIWHTVIGLPKEKINRLGEKDNFWQMGETGPCGPCSEIHVDRGAEKGCGKPTCRPGCDCPRFPELWNLVFMQFDRQQDGTLVPLQQKGVDTGMGFERLCMIMQNKDSIFDTELFDQLHKKIESLTNVYYAGNAKEIKSAFHVLSDHIRSSCLIIADSCTPSNEGRGYVLRKIIRRAALFAQKLSSNPNLFPSLAHTFIDYMGPIYPELKENKKLIISLLQSEVERFSTNLLNGQAILQSYIEDNLKAGKRIIEGAQAFKLYDTYGFPLELTSVIAKEHNFSIDYKGFNREMEKQQEQSGKKAAIETEKLPVPPHITTTFVGYEALETTSKITFVYGEGDRLWIVTEESPFYVESGGQVNDTGWVTINDITYPVIDLKSVGEDPQKHAIAVQISLKETKDPAKVNIKVGDMAHCVVDQIARMNTVRNHTATHLLQAALIQILGPSVKQAGSEVNPDYFRFDFTHHKALTKEEIAGVENLVNQKIQEAIPTKIYETTLAKAKEAGIISFFGEKYNPEKVRVVEVPGFSAELCGGTHAPNTGIIGCFKITSETALSTGVRRIVGVTGPQAVRLLQESFETVKHLGEQFKVKHDKVLVAVTKQHKILQKALSEIRQLKRQLWQSKISQWEDQIAPIGTMPFLYLEVTDLGTDDLKQIAQELEAKKPGFYFLVATQSTEPTRIQFLGYLSPSLKEKLDLKSLVKILKDLGLRGGGKGELIQGGGELPENLGTIVKEWLRSIV